jgi:hypothetical protein
MINLKLIRGKNTAKRNCLIHCNGETYDKVHFAEMMGLDVSEIITALENSETDSEFTLKINDILYRIEYGLSRRAKVYRRDGKAYNVDTLIKKTGISKQTAYYMLRQWEKGKMSWEDLHRSQGEITAKQFSTIKEVEPKIKISGLSPRRSVDDIKLGSWEMRQIEKRRLKESE